MKLYRFSFLAMLSASALLTGCGSGTFSNPPVPTPTPTPTPVPTPVPTVTCPPPPPLTVLPTPAAPTPVSGNAFTASISAGSAPIAGASVQLYAAGITGNGSPATALLSTPLTSDATGAVQVAATYTCPGAASNLYLVSKGGKTGANPSANAGLVLVSALGACNSVATGSAYRVDEPTTVAAAYALAPFYSFGSVGANIGSTATNSTGITNAFGTASELANSLTGTSPGAALPANVSSPAALVNSLANAVNACALSSSACSSLYSAAKPSGGIVPADTFDALYDIAHFPASNVAALYQASQASSAYPSALASQPTDWTMFLTVSGAGMHGPSGIGVDSTGSVWAASYFYTAAKFTPAGAPVFPGGITANGLNNSYGLAMDQSDNAWIPNEQPYYGVSVGSVSKLSPSGTSLAGSNGFMAGGLNYPISVAIDPNTTAWVVDYGNSYLTLLSATGTPLSGANGYTTSLFAFPVAVVVDANHYGWIANQSSSNVTRASADGTSFTNFNCCNGASGLAVDQGNNIWVSNFYGNSVSLITNTCSIASTGYTGSGGINHPQGIAVDGAGNVWVANYRAPYLTELSGTTGSSPGTTISPANGYGADAQLLEAYAIAADASGNLWVTNFGSNTLTKFIGLAAPVRTPLSGVVQQP